MSIAIVTGASSGMGREFVYQISKKYKTIDEIWVIARRLERLEEIKASSKVRPLALDLTEQCSFDEYERLLEELDPEIAVLVNASGYGYFRGFLDDPLEKQLDKSYSMYYEYEESGLPKYIIGDAMSPGKTYDAAKMQAIELAKTNLAGQIQTEVTALIESTVANEQISQDDAESIARTVQASKNLIVQRLGRTFTVTECYRKLANGTMEVRVTLAYNAKMAIDAAKAVIKAQLEEKGQDLHEQLDAMWGQL